MSRRARSSVAAALGATALALTAAPGAGAAVPLLPAAELISTGTDAQPAGATEVALAGGGRFAAFTSTATSLAPGQSAIDTNATCDVFRRDLVSGTTVLVSRVPGGVAGSACSSRPRISSEGTVVAFATTAANLIAAASGGAAAPAGQEQVLVADLAAGTLAVASRASGAAGALASGRQVDGRADFALSGDGSRVAFVSSDALLPGQPASGDQLWLRDLAAGTTTLVSAQDGTATTPFAESVRAPSVDQYGHRIAFATSALQVYVREPGEVTRNVSRTTLGATIDAANPAISATGNAVAYTTRAPSFSALNHQQVVVHDLSTATTTLASHPVGAPVTAAGDDVGPPSISARGNVVAFATRAANLGAGDPGARAQVYVADLRRELLSVASRASGGGLGNGASSSGGEGVLLPPSLAQDGIGVAFTSAATDLVAADTTSGVDAVMQRIRVPQAVPADRTREMTTGGLDGRNVGEQRRDGAGTTGEGALDLALSANGRYVAFMAGQDRYAGDPRPASGGDTVAYVRDRLTGEVEAVSRESDAGGRPGALMTESCSAREALALSSTGRYVTFCSGTGLYRRDRETGITAQVDVTPTGGDGNGDAIEVGISGNGRYVVFGSYADNLVAGSAPSSFPRLYRRDMDTGTTVRVDLRDGTTNDAGFTPPGIQLAKPSVTNDGLLVAFEYADASLVSGTGLAGGYPQAYVRDLSTNRTHLLNRATDGTYGRYGAGATGETSSRAPQLTPDGRFVVFSSDAGNLAAGKTNTEQAVYRRRLTFGGAGGAIDGALDLASIPFPGGGAQANGASGSPSISASGGRVAFQSVASNLLSGVTGSHAYARDLPGGDTVLLSRADGASGLQANGPTTRRPLLSADGSVAVFDSAATNLEGDAKNALKVFARMLPPSPGTDPPTNTVLPVVQPAAPRTGTPASCAPGTWDGTPSFTYQWLLDGAALAGQSDPTFVPSDAMEGQSLACRVTAANAAGAADATSVSVTITRAPPVVSITGTAVFAETITCDPGRWAGDPGLTFAWLLGDAPSAPGEVIAGATGATLELEAPVVERWVRCRATNATPSGPLSITSEARYVHPEVTVLRAPSPLTPPREGETATCSDTELRVRPSGLGVRHGYRLRILRANGEIASESAPTTAPTPQGPFATGTAGTRVACLDQGTVGESTTYLADGPVATIEPATPAATPAPTPAPAELPVPTSPPAVAFAGAPLERFCRAASYATPLTGLTLSFRWSYHDGARIRPVPDAELKAGLLGPGQVFTNVTIFAGIGNGGFSPSGLSCTQVVRDAAGRERATQSAVVRPEFSCRRVATTQGQPPQGGTPVAVYSGYCAEWDDAGANTTVAAAPPLPAPPITLPAGGLEATLQLGCGSDVTQLSGCRFTATLYAIATGRAARAQVGAAGTPVTARTRLGARLATRAGRVTKGRPTARLRLRLRPGTPTARALRRGRSVQTVLVVRYGRGTPRAVAAPILAARRR